MLSILLTDLGVNRLPRHTLVEAEGAVKLMLKMSKVAEAFRTEEGNVVYTPIPLKALVRAERRGHALGIEYRVMRSVTSIRFLDAKGLDETQAAKWRSQSGAQSE